METAEDHLPNVSDEDVEQQTLDMDDSDKAPGTVPSDEKFPKLHAFNMFNLIFFILNVIVTYGIGQAEWLGEGTSNGDLSDKYQTIITPKGTAFSIWGIIFLSQGVFTFTQLIPKYRSHPMVISGVKYWFVLACISQIGWTPSFATETIPLSLFFMIMLWLSLLGLLISQYRTIPNNTVFEFWLLRFPFDVHAGWITAATALNTNVVVVWSGAEVSTQLGVGIVSLAVLHAISVWVLFFLERPNYVLAFVLAWANVWIYGELQSPLPKISENFGNDIVDGVALACLTVSIIILVQILIRFSIGLKRKFRKEN